ncbi:hypothetical protein [Reinekea thalattae]|uniref:SH3 domain-containing protein n=1 Tax=Reinekea thalattae TaxID=2593301 RepID=A0A5C8ZAY2_9GAMM|nr:hypothetical protein [Reinekea thalattae]TXR54313.1 hypothetical protein FME95_07190 [Reinekea thalattae]
MTTMKKISLEAPQDAFWLKHEDSMQAAVHIALQWLAYVYPASELHIERTLSATLPYADSDLSSRASIFFDHSDVEDHVDALVWASENISSDQVVFLVETAWRLLLLDHELPTHVPLALRILGRVLSLPESRIQELGQRVFEEYASGDSDRLLAPLVPLDPRYLDRVEWRLHGEVTPSSRVQKRRAKSKPRQKGLFGSFALGAIFGVLLSVALIFGPLQLGRVKVPVVLHDFVDNAAQDEPILTPLDVSTVETDSASEEAGSETQSADVVGDAVAENTEQTAESQPTELTLAPAIPAPVTQPPVVASPIVINTPVTNSSDDSQISDANGEAVLMEVTASILNVRETASVDAEILIKLATGARVWAYPESAQGLWMLVRVEGETGYASARFLRPLEPSPAGES